MVNKAIKATCILRTGLITAGEGKLLVAATTIMTTTKSGANQRCPLRIICINFHTFLTVSLF